MDHTMDETCKRLTQLSTEDMLPVVKRRLMSVLEPARTATEWWEWLSGDGILAVSKTSRDYRDIVPWKSLCAAVYGCDCAETAEALGGWRLAFASFARVVRAGEYRRVDVLVSCLRRMREFSSPDSAMASLARTICSATASALGDVHVRLALCGLDDGRLCADSVVAAMRAWPEDHVLQERGTRSLVYVRLAHATHTTDCDGAVLAAFARHGAEFPAVAEAACAYALAVATEYAVSRRRRRDDDASLRVLERVARSQFYDGVVAGYLLHASTTCAHSELAVFYALSSLSELALAAKASRSRIVARAIIKLRDDLVHALHALAMNPASSDRVVHYAVNALHELINVSAHHRHIFVRLNKASVSRLNPHRPATPPLPSRHTPA